MSLESYFITSPALYPNASASSLCANLQRISSSHHIDKACFRDNSMVISPSLIDVFARWCEKNQIQSFINLANTELSIKSAKLHNLQGVHIKSTNLASAKKALEENLSVFYSSHCENEAQEAMEIGVNFITLSPIFPTPNKGNPLGVGYLKDLNPSLKKSLFALGGIINEEQISQIHATGVKGFASIRYFH